MTPLFERLAPARFHPVRLAARELLARRGVAARTASTSFGSMQYYEAGADHGGAPLVFLHGLASDALPMTLLAKAFADTRRCVLPDLFDFAGGSRRSTSASGHAPLDPGAHARSIDELLDALGIAEADVFGVSLGAWLALRLAATTRRVRSLFLVSPAGLRMDIDALRALADDDAPAAIGELRRRLVSQRAPFVGVPVVSALLERAMTRVLASPAVRGLAHAIRDEHFVDELLADVRCETFLMVGRDDRFLPPGGVDTLLARLPHARGVWVEGASHDLPIDAPANVYLELRRFLGETSAPHALAGRIRLHVSRLRRTTPLTREAP